MNLIRINVKRTQSINKNLIPILSGIKFELDNKGLTLTASDNDITIQLGTQGGLLGYDIELKQGVELVLKQFKDVLISKGVEEIPAMGETFDPALHEAVSSVQDPEKNAQEIVQEYRKGYKIGEKVIRHSMVKVANQ